MQTLDEQIAEISAKQPSGWVGMSLDCPDDVPLPLFAPAEPYCCVVGCTQAATVRVYDTRPETPYDVAETHACADHVRELGGDEPYSALYRFGDDQPFKSPE